MRRRKAYAREEKLQMIIGVFLEAFQRGQKDMTVAEVAHALDITPSTKLRDLLYALRNQDVLTAWTEPHPGIVGWRMVFGLSPNYIDYAKATKSQQKRGRELRINTPKGQFIEVLR